LREGGCGSGNVTHLRGVTEAASAGVKHFIALAHDIQSSRNICGPLAFCGGIYPHHFPLQTLPLASPLRQVSAFGKPAIPCDEYLPVAPRHERASGDLDAPHLPRIFNLFYPRQSGSGSPYLSYSLWSLLLPNSAKFSMLLSSALWFRW